MLEVNVKEQTEKLQAEMAQLNQQLQQIEQARNNLTAAILKKAGALELLQGLEKNGDKPKEETK